MPVDTEENDGVYSGRVELLLIDMQSVDTCSEGMDCRWCLEIYRRDLDINYCEM